MANGEEIVQNEGDGKTKADESAQAKPKADQTLAPGERSIWGVSYIKRKLHERKAKRENETPTDKAARLTTQATVWIAIFTVVLAMLSGLTWWEIHTGGTDTHDLAVAAGKQSDRTKDLVDQMKRQADETHTLAINAGAQATNAANEVAKLGDLVRATDKQATATAGQLYVMQKQFEAQERPWVDASVVANGPITIGNDGASIPFKMVMDNVGHSIAINIDSNFGVVNSNGLGTNQIEGVCSYLKTIPKTPGRGDTVFPGHSLIRNFLASIPKKDLRPVIGGWFPPPQGDVTERFAPIVFGCIDYQFDFSTEHHQTWFAYNVYVVDNAGRILNPPLGQGDIPAQRVGMSQLGIGHWAN